MTEDELHKRSNKIVYETLAKFEKDLEFGNDRRDCLMVFGKFGKGAVQFITGEMNGMTDMLVHMAKEHDEFKTILLAAAVGYLKLDGNNSLRTFIVSTIMDMIVESENIDKNRPQVKVLGMDKMPDSIKKLIGEELSKEFEGFMKPSKEDVKPSDN